MIRVALRCDASPAIGGGHVMRCLALAEALSACGCGLLLLVRPGTSEVAPALSRFHSCDVRIIEGRAASAVSAIAAHWPSGADLVIVDSYASDAEYETALRSAGRKIMVVDDLANRKHDCDLLLDQTCGRQGAAYGGLVPARARVLAGSRYALLRAEFAALRHEASRRREECPSVDRVLIAMGLTDVGGGTLSIARAALATGLAMRFDVVVGAKADSLAPLEALARKHSSVHTHVDPADLGRLMLEADIGIGALGMMTLERCCLGLPSIGVVLADNQRATAEEIDRAEAALVIRDTAELDALLPQMLRQLTSDPPLRLRLSRNALSLVDGQGSQRVAEAILETVCG